MRRIGGRAFVDPNDPRLPAALAERELTGTFRGELDYVRADGSVFPGKWSPPSSRTRRERDGSPRTSGTSRSGSEPKNVSPLSSSFRRSGKSMTAPDGRLIRVNKALCAFLGYSAEELQSRTIATVTHPSIDLAETAELIRALLAGERDIVDVEKRYVTRDRQSRLAEGPDAPPQGSSRGPAPPDDRPPRHHGPEGRRRAPSRTPRRPSGSVRASWSPPTRRSGGPRGSRTNSWRA